MALLSQSIIDAHDPQALDVVALDGSFADAGDLAVQCVMGEGLAKTQVEHLITDHTAAGTAEHTVGGAVFLIGQSIKSFAEIV